MKSKLKFSVHNLQYWMAVDGQFPFMVTVVSYVNAKEREVFWLLSSQFVKFKTVVYCTVVRLFSNEGFPTSRRLTRKTATDVGASAASSSVNRRASRIRPPSAAFPVSLGRRRRDRGRIHHSPLPISSHSRPAAIKSRKWPQAYAYELLHRVRISLFDRNLVTQPTCQISCSQGEQPSLFTIAATWLLCQG